MNMSVANGQHQEREEPAPPAPPVPQGDGMMRQVATWFSGRWSGRRRMRRQRDIEDPSLLEAFLGSSPVPQVQVNLSDKWIDMQMFSLTGSLARPDGVFKETFSSDYLWWVNLAFISWWGLVALGIPCSLYGRCWIERQYARLSGHLGLLGITVLVVMFSHWMLAMETTTIMALFLFFATVGFIFSYIRSAAQQEICDVAAIGTTTKFWNER